MIDELVSAKHPKTGRSYGASLRSNCSVSTYSPSVLTRQTAFSMLVYVRR
jgi:hypothetical protein